jgi:hypothetical protein
MTSPKKNPKLDSETLAYEFKMLCGTSDRLNTADKCQDPILYGALVESFAIHCRALLMFFFSGDPERKFPPPRDNDVVVQDFCSTWSEKWASHDSDYESAKFQADKHVAHITTDRQGVNLPNGGKSEWDIQKLMSLFHGLMKKFLDTVPQELVDVRAQVSLVASMSDCAPTPLQPFAPCGAGNTRYSTNASTPHIT